VILRGKRKKTSRRQKALARKQEKRLHAAENHTPRTPKTAPLSGYETAKQEWDKLRIIWANHKRRALELEAEGSYTPGELRELLEKQGSGCYYCGIDLEERHLEHKTPLCRGGTNHIDNLAWSCPKCNLKKGQRTEKEFRKLMKKKRKYNYPKRHTSKTEQRIRKFENNPAPVRISYIKEN